MPRHAAGSNSVDLGVQHTGGDEMPHHQNQAREQVAVGVVNGYVETEFGLRWERIVLDRRSLDEAVEPFGVESSRRCRAAAPSRSRAWWRSRSARHAETASAKSRAA